MAIALKKVKTIQWDPAMPQCVRVFREDREEIICHPIISELVFEGKGMMSEFHRLGPRQDLIIEFPTPVDCEFDGRVLRCPKGTKLWRGI